MELRKERTFGGHYTEADSVTFAFDQSVICMIASSAHMPQLVTAG